MNKTILVSLLFLTLIFARRDCLKYAERDALGRTTRPEKDTLAISPSGHFYIHFDTAGNHAPDLLDIDENGIPDYVDKVSIYADSAYFMLVDSMGYNVEPADNDGIYDIYIIFLAAGKYGFNWSEGSGISYVEIASNYEGYDSFATPEQLMQISLSHEYFHAIQRGYKPNYSSGDAYFLEMSSMWFEDIIVPNGNDYLGKKWIIDVLDNPTVAFDDTGPGYELALFGHYLSSFIDVNGSENGMHSQLIRNIWENFKSTSADPLALTSVKTILDGENYPLFIECWVDFISRNLYNGIYDDMDNPYYYYIDQALIDPIGTTSTMLTDSVLFELDLDNKSAAIESFQIGSRESLITIDHDVEAFTGRVAIVSSNKLELNNLFWGSDTTVEESFNDVEIHFIYGIDGSSITLPIEITAHTVPLPPSNLMAVGAQDSIILSWIPSPGPGEDLSYVIYREGDSVGISIDTNYVDKQSIEVGQPYTYKVTCRNNIGESNPSSTITVTSWPDEENVLSSKIMNIYPNPIRQTQELIILYALDSDYSNPIIDLINIRGEIVNSINLSSFAQGWHRENINSILNNNPSNGVYFIRLQPDQESRQTKKIIILN